MGCKDEEHLHICQPALYSNNHRRWICRIGKRFVWSKMFHFLSTSIHVAHRQLKSFSNQISFVSYNNEIQRKLRVLKNKGTLIMHFFQPCSQKNHMYTSDCPAPEHMKFVCTVNVYASGTVHVLQTLQLNHYNYIRLNLRLYSWFQFRKDREL